MDFKRNIIVTGGAGFIGSHVVRLFVSKYPDYRIVNVDKLTYAGNLENLRDVEREPNYVFVRADICDYERMSHLMREYRADGVIHLAAESHVDRSIRDPFTFARTNVLGTLALLEAARVSRLPIMIYTDDALVLDAVLLRFPGRLLVDSLCEIERDLLEDIALHFGAILF